MGRLGDGRTSVRRAGAEAVFAAFALLAAACTPDGPADLQDQLPCTLSAELQAELGRLEDPASIRSVWWDHTKVVRARGGGWIVASEATPPPLAYSPDGTYQGVLGRAGEGPGEFRMPRHIAIDGTDSIWVSDSDRVVVLDPSGRPARTLASPGYSIDGFTPTNEPYSVLVRVPESREPLYRYVMVRSRDLEPIGGFGPGLDDPDAHGRTIGVLNRGTFFIADSIVLTNDTWDMEQSWIDRWTPGAHEVLLPRLDVWRVLGQDGDPLPPLGQFVHVSFASDGEGGYWSAAAVPRTTGRASHEDDPSWWSLEPDERMRAFVSYLLHISSDGEITGFVEIPEAHPHFIDHEHVVSPRVDGETGLITLRIWRIRRDC